MNFLGIFRAQNDCLVIGYLMGAEIFEFRPNLGPWQLFKEGNWPGILANFATPFFKPPFLGPGVDFLDIFCAQNDCLVIGYLMGTEIF